MEFKPLRTFTFTCFLISALNFAALAQSNPSKQKRVQKKPVQVQIDLSKTGEPISRLMYGDFIELLSNWFEGGLWSEMLGDRKFYYPVNNKQKQDPPNSRSWILSQWRPVGQEQAITMDKQNPYVGKQSPKINLSPTEVRGIRQDSLPLQEGKNYEGHIVLAGDPGTKVKVSLIWGNNPNDRQTVTISSLSDDYQTFPFHFTSKADTRTGKFEITSRGSGSFLVGTASLMPADNIDGFRPDLIKLLKGMNIGIIRWGGNFSSGYDWRAGIGNRDKRPPKYDHAWGALVSNDVGTFEILRLCQLIGAKLDIGVNAGFGDAHSAAQWVEYVNGSTDTEMGTLRAKHGHPKPFDVKWWGIGNEMYGDWQLGHMKLQHFIWKHNKFARYMKKVDPTIKLVASGATPFEMSTTLRHWTTPTPDSLPVNYGSQFDWSGGLLKGASQNFDYLAEHFYPLPGKAFDKQKQKFVDVDAPVVDQLRRPANRVEAAVEAWHKYHRMMPKLNNKDIKMVLDEWVSGSRGLKGALGVATVLNEIFRHTDVFAMSAYTCAPCNLAYDGIHSTYRGTGLVFKMYSGHFGKIPVQVDGHSPQPEVPGTIGVDKPQKTSGSPTYPLDVMAALSQDKKSLTIAVVNPTNVNQTLDLDVSGGTLSNRTKKWIITGDSLDAHNQAGKEPRITLTSSVVSNLSNSASVDPLSVSLFEIPVK